MKTNRKTIRLFSVVALAVAFAMSIQLTSFATTATSSEKAIEVTAASLEEGTAVAAAAAGVTISGYITTPPTSTGTPSFGTLTPNFTGYITVTAVSLPGSSFNFGATDNSTGSDQYSTYITSSWSFYVIANHTYSLRASTYSTSGYATFTIS